MIKSFLYDNAFYLVNSIGMYVSMYLSYQDNPTPLPIIASFFYGSAIVLIFWDWYESYQFYEE
jgi:hypothetical protein